MAVKLVACDIDNTLPPSSRMVRALRAAGDAGVTVALVTGVRFGGHCLLLRP